MKIRIEQKVDENRKEYFYQVFNQDDKLIRTSSSSHDILTFLVASYSDWVTDNTGREKQVLNIEVLNESLF